MKAPHDISIASRPAAETYLHDRARRISRDQRKRTGRLMEFLSSSKYSFSPPRSADLCYHFAPPALCRRTRMLFMHDAGV